MIYNRGALLSESRPSTAWHVIEVDKDRENSLASTLQE